MKRRPSTAQERENLRGKGISLYHISQLGKHETIEGLVRHLVYSSTSTVIRDLSDRVGNEGGYENVDSLVQALTSELEGNSATSSVEHLRESLLTLA